MTEEEAIEILKEWLCNVHSKFCSVGAVGIPDKEWYATETVLNLIQKKDTEIKELIDFNKKLQATKDRLDKYDKENTIKLKKQDTEINKLNNVIDDLVGEVAYLNYETIGEWCNNDKGDKCKKCNTNNYDCIKEYFMKEDK